MALPLSLIASGAINGIGSTLATFTMKGMQGEVLEREFDQDLISTKVLAGLG